MRSSSTGKVSAAIFQAMYGSNLPAYDTFVWFYGETTDRYGNKSNDVIVSYSIDKPTFGKINWQNFDPKTLCDFLQKEQQITGASGNAACNVLVNIQ